MYLGIDIGTSSVKAVLINEESQLVESSSSSLPISRPHPLWSEQNPINWWDATNEAVNGLNAINRRKVQAIGLTGQMHGATLIDNEQNPLRPAILWNDGRSHIECSELQEVQSDFVSIGANLVMPGFTAPKLAWVRKHEADIFDKIDTILLPKDYVRLCMCGEYASDMSDSAGTLWMDVENRKWHDPLLEACGLNVDHMPRLYEGTEETGRLKQEVADAWSMDSVPIIAGGGDNAAGAVGAAVINDGDALMSLGTSGVIFAATNVFRSNPESAVHSFCHAIPERWHLMSVMLSAASCIDWAMSITGVDSAKSFIAQAEKDSQLACGVDFLPYLSGERTPHNDPHASGVLFGLNHDTNSADIAQSVLEGIAFGMADGFKALLSAGASIDKISVIGGGSQSQYWGRILAAALNRPLIYRDGSETGPAFGAARLARYSKIGGDYSDTFAPSAITDSIEPQQDDIERLNPKMERFSRLYKALSQEYKGVPNG